MQSTIELLDLEAQAYQNFPLNPFGFLFVPGFLLLMRVMAVTFCVTLSASLAARQGPTSMAAFQVCLQVWLATSLLADGLAVAGQVRATPHHRLLV